MSDILCGISKGTFEIPHKISYPYHERCKFYLQVKNLRAKSSYAFLERTQSNLSVIFPCNPANWSPGGQCPVLSSRPQFKAKKLVLSVYLTPVVDKKTKWVKFCRHFEILYLVKSCYIPVQFDIYYCRCLATP